MGPWIQKGLIISCLSSIAISNGLIYGQSTGMISDLQRNEGGFNFTDSEVSMITSALPITSSLGFGLATISDRMGRRWPLIIFSAAVIIQWVVLYKAQNIFLFMLSRIIAGVAVGARYSLNILITSEYTSPKTRAFFLNIITTVSPTIGTALGHYLGIIYHWRNLAFISIFPTILGIILPYFCVESPHWLASKGRFQECEQNFRILHGNNSKTEQELQQLIKMEKCKLNHAEITNTKTVRKKLFFALRKKYFWNLIFLSFLIFTYYTASGKLSFVIFATTIIEDLTGTSNVLLYTMLVDGFLLTGACLSCILVRKMTLRHTLFLTGFMANAVLIILCGCLYFGAGIEYLRWVNVTLLAVYFILIESGPSPVLEALLGEIFPLEIKLYCLFLAGFMFSIFLTLSLVLYPILTNVIGYYGIFLLNVGLMTTSLILFWLKLPETKGRTLQEIEAYFKTKAFDIDNVLNDEKQNMLL